jgi:acetyl esterase/lipase
VFLPQARWIDADGVRVRVLAPEEPRGVYLHLHGGGWTLGAADLQDESLNAIAESTGLAVASVEYRLAPEHPFPAGPDDCERAARWLVGGGHLELGAPPVFAIGGESAGRAPRRADAAPAARDGSVRRSESRVRRLRPFRDPEPATLHRRARADRRRHGLVHRQFPAGSRRGAASSARHLAALRRSRDLPPALFSVGTLDPLLDDSLFMAARWQSAGNETELQVYEEAVHGFNAFPIAVARLANDAQLAFLARVAADTVG